MDLFNNIPHYTIDNVFQQLFPGPKFYALSIGHTIEAIWEHDIVARSDFLEVQNLQFLEYDNRYRLAANGKL